MDEEVQEANSPRFASSDEDEEVHDEQRPPHMQDEDQVLVGEDNAGAGDQLGIVQNRRAQKTANAQRVQLLNQQLRNNQTSAQASGQGANISPSAMQSVSQNSHVSRAASNERESPTSSSGQGATNQSAQYQQH